MTVGFKRYGEAPSLALGTSLLGQKADDSENVWLDLEALRDFMTGNGVQASDAMLTALAGLTSANNKGLYFTGADTPALFDLTAYGRTLGGLADAAALKTLLLNMGLGVTVAADAAAITHTGDTAETIFVAATIPALGANDWLEIESIWSYTNSVNAKSIRHRFNGTGTVTGSSYASPVPTTTAGASYRTAIHNRNATNSQIGGPATGQDGAASAGVVTTTVDTSATSYVVFTGQLANSGESLTLDSYRIKQFRKPV